MGSAEDLFGMWLCPTAAFRSAPFWSWNSKLQPQRLTAQIENMQRAGMGGFFMHSRYGLKTAYLSEEWFQCVSACVAAARRLHMKAYLYDEDRWPSGIAGGLVTRTHPEFRATVLEAVSPDSQVEGAERLGVFALELDDQGRLTGYAPAEGAQAAGGRKVLAFDVLHRPVSARFNDGACLDVMNGEAVAEFIRVTHQAYADRFADDFGDAIPAIFTDEPNYGHAGAEKKGQVLVLPWTAELPREFMRRRGYDFRDRLPELFFADGDEGFSRLRCDYYRTITELFVESYSAQIGRWCGRHRLASTGHVLREQTMREQVSSVGSAMPHYEHMQWPGIDILTDSAKELTTAKQCSSVADQLGKARVLSELYGCTGWDWPLEGHKFIGDWQYACGVNFRCPHLSHYSLAGGAKRDYPASIYAHSPWWPYYSVVEDYFARLSFMLTQGRPVRDVLVLHPIESAWGCFLPDEKPSEVDPLQQSLDRILFALSGEHYDWDFADESLLAKHAKLGEGRVKLGSMSYGLVVVPPTITLRSSTVSLLRKFLADGGKVLFVGRTPHRIDAQVNPQIAELIASARTCGELPEQFLPVLQQMLPRRLSVSKDGAEQHCVWSMLRAIKGGQLLFLQSHDRSGGRRLRVSVSGHRPVVLWDARSGDLLRVKSEVLGERVEFDLDLPPTGSALLSVGLSVRGAAARGEPKVRQSTPLDGPYAIELTEPNTLPLDYCRFRIGEGEFSQPAPTLTADRLIRKHFGLPARSNSGCQPWYLYATGKIDLAPRGRCQMKWTFHVTDVPARCKLALEAPENYTVTVNGRPAGAAEGFWVDEEIKTIDVSSLLQRGENEVLLDFDYRADMELEDMYLVGDFGVARRSDGPPAPGNMTLTAPPRTLNAGSWVGQGLDFYGAAVRYRLQVQRPSQAKGMRIRLPRIACTAAAIHVNGKTFVLPWGPFEAEITEALADGTNEVTVEVIGGRKNILGPLHTPWEAWTGPGNFDPASPKWTPNYHLVDHGLMEPVVIETLA